MKKSQKASDIILLILMIFLLIGVLSPLIWLVFSSIKFSNEIIQYPPSFFPSAITLSQYVKVWRSIPILSYFINTVIFAGGVTLFSILFDSMAAYALARIEFKGKNQIFIGILVTMMIPFQVIMIPLFVELFKIGMLNTYWGLILPRATSAFGIFMMRAFFVSLPKDLEESARIDGLNEYKIYWYIMLPLCIPAMITLGIILFMNNWNDLIYPLMLTSSTEMRTLPAGLALFVGDKVIEYGPIMAAATLSILPLLIAYIFAQKYFVQGIATTGLKS